MSPELPAEAQPVCDICQSDEYLVYERVRAVSNTEEGEPQLWDVDCWCGNCETFYGYRTTHPPEVRHSIQPTPETPLSMRRTITFKT